MKIKAAIATGILAISMLAGAGVAMAQTVTPTTTPSPTMSPTPTTTVPNGAPSTGHGN